MLEKTVDLSEYVWVKNLKKALDKGLAALYIAKEKYGVSEMTCVQMEVLLTRSFPVKVTRAAINMAFLDVKSEYVAATIRGKEISYSLLPLGKDHLLKIAEDARKTGKEVEPDDSNSGVEDTTSTK